MAKKELQHHGITGQKWGVRNGPPYPLSEASSSLVKSTKKSLTKSERDYIKNTVFLTDEELDKVIDVAFQIGVPLVGAAGVVAAGYLAVMLGKNASTIAGLASNLDDINDFVSLENYALDNAPKLSYGFNRDTSALKPFALGDQLFKNFSNGSYIGSKAQVLGYKIVDSDFISNAIANPVKNKLNYNQIIKNVRINVADPFANRRLSCWSASNSYYMSVLTGRDFASKSFENLVDFNDFGKLYKKLPTIFDINGKEVSSFVGSFGRSGTRGNEQTAKVLIESIFKNISSSNNLDPTGKNTIGFINAAYNNCTCTHQWNFEIFKGANGIKTLFISDGYVGTRYPVANINPSNINNILFDNKGLNTLIQELGHYNSESIRFYAPALDSIDPKMLSKILLGKSVRVALHSGITNNYKEKKMNENELYHYGVLGMKWGVRRYQPYTDSAKSRIKRIKDNPSRYIRGGIQNEASRYSNIFKYGWKKGHGKNVYSRIQKIKADDSRTSLMSQRQKESLNNAEKYWKNRAEGKGYRKSGKRGIIKRAYDASRSHSLGRRFVATSMISMGGKSLSDVAVTYSSLVTDELLNKLFGHF